MKKLIAYFLEVVIFEKLLTALMNKNSRGEILNYFKKLDKNSTQYKITRFAKYIIIFIISWMILLLVLVGFIIYFLIRHF